MDETAANRPGPAHAIVVVSKADADANEWGEAAVRRFLAEPGAHLAFVEARRREGGERGGGH